MKYSPRPGQGLPGGQHPPDLLLSDSGSLLSTDSTCCARGTLDCVCNLWPQVIVSRAVFSAPGTLKLGAHFGNFMA